MITESAVRRKARCRGWKLIKFNGLDLSQANEILKDEPVRAEVSPMC